MSSVAEDTTLLKPLRYVASAGERRRRRARPTAKVLVIVLGERYGGVFYLREQEKLCKGQKGVECEANLNTGTTNAECSIANDFVVKFYYEKHLTDL
ncbi:hypothetical protein TELCIR_02767 [Teladorsagia circumcincta]|uniref:Uncharacterized protein n=1 Tax=Teladorsagia circumcincta TaxID=45464 RepID=A0A2G9UZN7_TELCI|nr:hypothetical protein TELCIR_02767 [Teladorsagia circumcincta]